MMVPSALVRSAFRPQALALILGVVLLALGVGYRLSFIYQGFNATDDGYIQSLASRIVHGEVPYRDFYWLRTPLTIYKEALFLALFGKSYTLLCSRIIFAIEISLSSVLAYSILRRFTDTITSFLVTLPTLFFSVLLFYFSWYTYDGEFFLLLSVALLAYSSYDWKFALLAGVCACLAFLAKQNFLAFAVLVVLGGIAAPRLTPVRSEQDAVQPRQFLHWPAFLIGFILTLTIPVLYFAGQGALPAFLRQAFVLPGVALPETSSFLLWQDLPQYLFSYPNGLHSIGLVVALALLICCVGVRCVPAALRVLVLVALVVLDEGFYLDGASPAAWRTFFIATMICLLLLLNALALVVAILAHGPRRFASPYWQQLRERLFRPELPFCAFALQYLSQYSYSGIILSYIGSFLSIPTALLFLSTLAKLRPPVAEPVRSSAPARRRRRPRRAAHPTQPSPLFQPAAWRWTPVVLGIALIGGSAALVRSTVYRDGDRGQLTATFHTPRLAGITSLPANVQTLDALVAGVRCSTAVRDRIFVFPDLAALYFLTDRRNATKVEWWTPPEVTMGMVQEAVTTLQRHPPPLVLLEYDDEADYQHTELPLNYSANPKWFPIYQFLMQDYVPIGGAGGIQALIPRSSSPQVIDRVQRCWNSPGVALAPAP